MRRLLKYTALILMVLMVSGSAWAFSYADHVTMAPNNKAQVEIFPWYLALDGGWQTKLTVINTDEVNSVVAKLIIRSFKNSEELLDFFLYLSPADVWTGIMKVDATTKKVVITSTDDSCLGSTSGITLETIKWANTAGNALHQVMFPLSCSDDGDYLGYIEIITAADGPVSPAKPGVAKVDIWKAYDALLKGATSSLIYAGTRSPVQYNFLAAWMEFQNPLVAMDSTLSATSLKDYGNNQAIDTSVETRLGKKAKNSLGEVEAALSKDELALPYVKNDDLALHIFTFPTKLTDTTLGCTVGKLAVDSPYFKQHSNTGTAFCVPYKVIAYDLQENTPTGGSPFSGGDTTTREFCNEVNLLASPSFPYTEGWAHYYFRNGTTTAKAANTTSDITYAGTPVLATFLYIGKTGLTAGYGAWTDDLVYCGPTILNSNILIDYQYTDSALGTCLTQ